MVNNGGISRLVDGQAWLGIDEEVQSGSDSRGKT